MAAVIFFLLVAIVLIIAFFAWLFENHLVAFIVIWSIIGFAFVATVVGVIIYAIYNRVADHPRRHRKPQSKAGSQPSSPVVPAAYYSETPRPPVYQMPKATKVEPVPEPVQVQEPEPEPEINGLQSLGDTSYDPADAGEYANGPAADTAPVQTASIQESQGSCRYPYPESLARNSQVDDIYSNDNDMEEDAMYKNDWDDPDPDDEEDDDWDDFDDEDEDVEDDDDDILDDDDDEDEDDLLQDEYVREKKKKDLQDYYNYYDPHLKLF